jgi:hypothetical protein
MEQFLSQVFALWKNPLILTTRQQITAVKRDRLLPGCSGTVNICGSFPCFCCGECPFKLSHIQHERRMGIPLQGFGIRQQVAIGIEESLTQVMQLPAQVGASLGRELNLPKIERQAADGFAGYRDAVPGKPTKLAGVLL